MDVQAGWAGTLRDLASLAEAGWLGWVMLLLVAGLPVASLLLVARGSRLALVPLAVSVLVSAGWFLHHATGLWNAGLAFAVVPLLAVGAGWCLLLVALSRTVLPVRTARA